VTSGDADQRRFRADRYGWQQHYARGRGAYQWCITNALIGGASAMASTVMEAKRVNVSLPKDVAADLEALVR